jgi:hypothetical protein
MPLVSLPLINEHDIAFPLRLVVDPDSGLYVDNVFIEKSKYNDTIIISFLLNTLQR